MSEWDKEFSDKLKEKVNSLSETPPTGLWNRVMAEFPAEPVSTKTKWSRMSLVLALGLVALSGIVLRQDAVNTLEIPLQQGSAYNESKNELNEDRSTSLSTAKDMATVTKSKSTHGSLAINEEKIHNEKPVYRAEGNHAHYLPKSKSFKKGNKTRATIKSSGLPNSLVNSGPVLADAPDSELKPLSEVSENQSGHGDHPIRINPSLLNSAAGEFLIDTSSFIRGATALIDSAELKKEIGTSMVWDVTLVGGPNIGYRSMTSQVHADVVSHRNEHEKSAINYNVGFELGMKYKRLKVSIGFGYFERGERYFFQGQNIKHEFKNKYSYFSMPVNFSYDLLTRNRFTLSPMVGYAFNLLQQGQASWLNPHNHSEVHMSSKHANPYRQSGHMLSGSVQLGYQFNRRVKLLYRLGYTHFLQSIYKPSMALDQRQYSIDHQFGIQVPLSR
jgi:hypothetical protein